MSNIKRVIRRGAVSIGGVRYLHHALARLTGMRVICAVDEERGTVEVRSRWSEGLICVASRDIDPAAAEAMAANCMVNLR